MRAFRFLLLLLALCLITLACLGVPRLASCLWSDLAATGWTSPIAQRMVAGEQIYRDFTLTLPPGAFLVMAAVQRLAGRALLLDELWLCAGCQLGMLAAGCWLCRRLFSLRIAVVAAAATGPILLATPQEIAYDQLAQLLGWVSLALLAWALSEPRERRRCRALWLAGFASAITLLFKTSAGGGTVSGSLVALGTVTLIGWRAGRAPGLRALGRLWAALAAGLVTGLGAVVLTVWLAGGDLAVFGQTVYLEGLSPMGGSPAALLRAVAYTAFQTPVKVTLVSGLLLAWVLVRLLPRSRSLALPPAGEGSRERRPLGPGFTAALALLILLFYGTAILLLAGEAARVPVPLRMAHELSLGPVMLGFLALAALVLINLRGAAEPLDRRAVLAAVALGATAQWLCHNLALPELSPFYHSGPVVMLAIAALFHVIARARARLLAGACSILLLLGLFGDKLQRRLDARHPVADGGFWRGLTVSHNGLSLLGAARQARRLAGAQGSVMMLPEDPMIMALIGRRRPRLLGGIVFADQYPGHVLARDLATLQADPPTVLVLHPTDPGAWRGGYYTWPINAPAELLQAAFLSRRLLSDYRLDQAYPTWFFEEPSQLHLWVRQR